MPSSSLSSPGNFAAPPPRPAIFSIQTLADNVNQWCEENGVRPVNGQSAPQLNDRNIRYYRLRGLLDAPGSGAPEGAARRGFTEKHAAQLRVIRLLQARGLPLDRIQLAIAGQSLDELRGFQRREMGKPLTAPAPAAAAGTQFGSRTDDGNGIFSADSNGSGAATAKQLSSQHLRAGNEVGAKTDAQSEQADGSAPNSTSQEQWLVSAVGEEFLLVSRRGNPVSDEQRRLIAAVLRA